MKKLGIITGVFAIALALVPLTQADIGVQVTSDGGYLNGGTWGGGVWPANGSLITIIWSPTDFSGANQVIEGTLVADPTEEIIGTTPSLSYGLLYVQSPIPPAVKTGLSPNSGFIYARLFSDVAPALGSQFSAGPAFDGSTAGDYSPSDSSTWVSYAIPLQEMGGVVAPIPEPGTLALCGLGLVAMFVRRKRG